MEDFEIQLRSVQQVLQFVSLATSRDFPVYVTGKHHRVSGKSFMEMFCLDFSFPLTARLECTAEEFEEFRKAAHRFAVK